MLYQPVARWGNRSASEKLEPAALGGSPSYWIPVGLDPGSWMLDACG